MGSGPELIAVGLDHTGAGIETRERLAFADAEIPAALRRLTDSADPLLEQAAILSTCNRVELYGVSRSRPDARRLASFLAQASTVAGELYVYRDEEVAQHLAATAAGLRSLVLGEAQILGQVRNALEHAFVAGTTGTELRRLFESAISAGRRVRAGTAIGQGATSVSYAGVELARRRLGSLGQAVVLLIGTGDVAELAAQQLVKRGARRVLILGRSPAPTRRLAASCGGRPITADRLQQALSQCDVVITATSAQRPILHRDELHHALAARRAPSIPLLVIDLAVPRDVDPAASELSGVEVHTVDDLRSAVEHTLVQRRAELPRAYAILGREVARFTTWLSRRESLECCPS